MSDCCWLHINFLKKDLPKIEKILGKDFFDDVLEETDELLDVQVYEANFSWLEDRYQLAASGVIFLGSHGPGGNYGSFAFAAIDNEMVEVGCDTDGDIVVPIEINANGEPRPHAACMKKVGQFVKMRRRIEAVLHPEKAPIIRQQELPFGPSKNP